MAEDESEDGRRDDAKLIASLKNRMKVLKKGYLEERDQAANLQKELAAAQQKIQRLEEALTEKETLCANLNKEVVTLQDSLAAEKSKAPGSPVRGSKQKGFTEADQAAEALKRENEELQGKLTMMKESLENNETLLTEMKTNHNVQVQTLTTSKETLEMQLHTVTTQLQEAQKGNEELQNECSKYKTQCEINFEQRR